MNSHAQRFYSALGHYRAGRGRDPDRRWEAMLFVLTLRPGVWSGVEGRIDYRRGTADLDGPAYLSQGERLLLGVARNLFTGTGAVNVDELAALLDDHAFETVVAALRLRRGETAPAQDLMEV